MLSSRPNLQNFDVSHAFIPLTIAKLSTFKNGPVFWPTLYFIFPETRVIGLHFCRCMYGSIFIQICEVGSQRRIFLAPECDSAVQGRSGSSKVDDFGTNRKRVYDFLLVGHCYYGPVLHRFWDTVTYLLKIAYFWYIFATPVSFGVLTPYVPFGISRWS